MLDYAYISNLLLHVLICNYKLCCRLKSCELVDTTFLELMFIFSVIVLPYYVTLNTSFYLLVANSEILLCVDFMLVIHTYLL